MDLVQFFIGLEGRVGRIGYAVPLALIAFMSAVIIGVTVFVAFRDDSSSLYVLIASAFVVMFAPWVTFALTWKRLHDIGVSGFYAFMLFVPVVSAVLVLVLCFLPGDAAANEFGEPEPI